jgi:hypothetical protein
MRFYYYNNMGDEGYFSETNIIKAIYTAWNIEADLWLLNKGIRKVSHYELINKQAKLVFSSTESNEFNSDVLKEFGYYMTDGEGRREIRRIDNNQEVKFDWSEVRQLV